MCDIESSQWKLYVTIRSISSAGQPAWLYRMHAVKTVSQHGHYSLPTRLVLRGQELHARLVVAGSASIRCSGCMWASAGRIEIECLACLLPRDRPRLSRAETFTAQMSSRVGARENPSLGKAYPFASTPATGHTKQ